MFSEKKFIEASRDFVCVRLETFENKEHEALVREILNGRFANTSFCIFSPDGKTQLTRSSRGPKTILGAKGRGPSAQPGSLDEVVAAMADLVEPYPRKGRAEDLTLQDFHSFRQALNVASGDQRLLLFVAASPKDREKAEKTLQPVFATEEIIGRFHLDFGTAEADSDWSEKVSGIQSRSGYFVIQADQFGQKGKVVYSLPLSASGREIANALLSANASFAEAESRKVYSEHVTEGRRENIFFENEIPYGEDRDGDGKADGKRYGKGRG